MGAQKRFLSQHLLWQVGHASRQAKHTVGASNETIASNLKPWNVGGSSARSAAVKSTALMSELSSETTANVLVAPGRSDDFHCGYVEMKSWSALVLSTPCGTWRYVGRFSSAPPHAPLPSGAGMHTPLSARRI